MCEEVVYKHLATRGAIVNDFPEQTGIQEVLERKNIANKTVNVEQPSIK